MALKQEASFILPKSTDGSGFMDLDIHIKLKDKTDPKANIYVVVYGVRGYQNDVSVHLWDLLYYFVDDTVRFEAPIDMATKDISNVGSMAITGDVNMESNEIKYLADGLDDNDAANIKQLKALDTKITSLKTKANELETSVNALETSVNSIQNHVNTLKNINKY